MLDFRRRSPSVNYLQGKQQYKLFGLMACAAVIMLLVSLAADPGRWEWVFAGQKPRAGQGRGAFAPDTRLAAKQTDDEPGTFISTPEGLSPQAAAKPDAFFPGVRTDYLQMVRDDTVFRKVESDAWFQLLHLLSKTDPAALAQASTGVVSFRQLFQQPKEYRGRVVTLEGTVRGVAKKDAPKNTYGIGHYYQLAIEPDGEKGQLVFVYCLELPRGFPLGDKLAEHATFHGFFFKRWAYAAQDAVRTAPLILARSFAWKPAPPPEVNQPALQPLAVVGIAFGLFLIVALGYGLTRSLRTSPPVQEASTASFSPEVLAALTAADEGPPTGPSETSS